jgi:RNA-directed DNA polymerase
MLERAQQVTRQGRYAYVQYARFADDLVVLVDAYRRHDWLLKAISRRLREEFGRLHVEINEDKSRLVDLAEGESFGFLGFDFRRMLSLRGVWRPHVTPQRKRRTVLLRKLKDVFRRFNLSPLIGSYSLSTRFCADGCSTFVSVMQVDASASSRTGWKRRCGDT